jgi:fructose-1-phosphate kinase PfkB-like protein
MGIAQSRSFEVALKLGVAAGTANAMTIGAGVLSINDFQQVLLGTVCRR